MTGDNLTRTTLMEFTGEEDAERDGEDDRPRKLLTTLLAVHTPFGAPTLRELSDDDLAALTTDVVMDNLADEAGDDADGEPSSPTELPPTEDRTFL